MFRRSREPRTIAPDPIPILPPSQSLARFVDKTRSILADVQAIEKQLISEKARRRRLTLERKGISQDRRPDSTSNSHRQSQTKTSCEFAAFCDRLLLTNRIWKQEKELKALRAAATAKTQAQSDTAFKTFCEQLLLWNKIWKLEREAVTLAEEKERIQRERVAAVTRAAKRMVLDVQKERLVEEFVKDLIGDVAAAKAEVWELRVEHEKEVQEINGDWMRDYARVKSELAQIRLAQEARLLEQDMSNTMEESLFESLREAKRRIEELEGQVGGYSWSDEATLNDADGVVGGTGDQDDETTDVEFDTLSELSSSSTCVSSGGSIQRPVISTPGSGRRRCISQGPLATGRPSLHPRSSTLPRSIGGVSFPLKPLMVDQAKSTLRASTDAATRTCNHSGRPLAVRNRTTSVSVRSPSSASSSGMKAVTMGKVRAPWRV
ncbi:hypothetical protein FPV67DRAFT_1505924 [Lyophyllum atratum]|nr:hypothetical protein FPV67DRAFT_1505924 [Lyophyllum atratum]